MIEITETLKTVLDSFSDHISIIDKELNILWVNKVGMNNFGENIVNRKCYEVYHKRDTPCKPHPCHTIKSFQDGNSYTSEKWIIDKQGKHRFFVVTSSVAFWDDEGNPLAVLEITRDMTFVKRTEKEINENEKRFRELYERAPLPYQSLDKNGIILEINSAWLRTLGYRANEVLGTNFSNYIHPDSNKFLKATFPVLLTKGEVNDVHFVLKRKDSSTLTVSLNGKTGLDQQGNFKQTHCIFHDITEKKLWEDKLRKSEEKFHTMADSSYDWEIWHAPDGKYLYISPSCERITGYSKEYFLNDYNFISSIVHPDDLEKFCDHRQKHLTPNFEKSEITYRIITKTGEIRWVWHQCHAAVSENGEWLGRRTSNRDVTLLKEMEQKLRENEKLLKQAQEIAKVGHWQLSLENNALYWSDEIFNIFDIDPHQFKATYEAFVELIHPDDRELVNKAYLDSVAQKTAYNIEHRIVLKNGLEKWVHERGVTQYDIVGTPIRSVGTVQDITENKKQEEERLQINQQKEQLKKLESLKTMAGAIAHRFNNAMMVVQGNLQLMTCALPADSNEYKMASAAAKAASGASQVGSMMLSYVGQQPLKLEDLPVGSLVRESVTALKNLLQSSISLKFTPPDQPLYCSMDQKQIKEVIVNVITNAIESLNDGSGTIEITFGTDFFTADSFPISFQKDNLQDGVYTFCQIKDSGHGINPKDLSRIFEPFYTTRFVGRGLGLALAVGIMQSHHGALTVESLQDKGTTIRVLLPSIPSTQQTTPPF